MPGPDDYTARNARFGISPVMERVRKIVEWRKTVEEEREAERLRQFDSYLNALSLLMECDRILDEERPRKYSEEWNDAFCTALKAREELRLIVEELEIMISATEERKRK